MNRDDAVFVNALRAVFRMPPLYQDGRFSERAAVEDSWLPAFTETGHVQPRNPGGACALADRGDTRALKRFAWNWKVERAQVG